MKKILQIIPSFGIGGAEKVVLDYLRHYDKTNYEMRALSLFPSQGSNYDQIIKDENLPVIYLDKKPGFDFSMIKKIKNVMEEYNPDIVHIHIPIVKYLIPSMIRRRKKTKFFYTIHNEPEKDAPGLEGKVNRFAIKRLGLTPIALSSRMAKASDEFYKIQGTKVLGNGIDISDYVNPNVDTDQLISELNIQDCFVMGHVGRFSKQKNHEFLISILNEVVKQKDNAVLLLAGDGELKANIMSQVNELGLNDHVRFLGIRGDVKELLKVFDAFVFPSLHEGFPITLLEAQASGVRCVISDVIDEDVILSENTIVCSLNQPASEWVQPIINPEIKSHTYYPILEFDITNVMNKLMNIYFGESHE